MAKVNVEAEFTAFIRAFGGTVVSDLVGASPEFPNADYYFPEECVVAELKCLEDNKREDPNLQQKVQSLFDRWIAEGTIPVIYGDQVTVQSKSLPEACQYELYDVYKPAIQRRIVKANKQIKATATRLRVEPYLGLLLLANDGNYAMEAAAILHQVRRILGTKFQHINTVVYFTVNMDASSPWTKKSSLVWAHMNRTPLPGVTSRFTDQLLNGWIAHLGKITGEEIDTYQLSGLAEVEEIKYRL
ncbi:MAG: hypothetical protein Q7U63_14850 [Polaromonas sp.]|uniref:hypothetical protein n=1 Tax=Polaromonas sp. TaxID=1869339 RepID=UPI002728EABD|nr:hypothetical protein [Polaromonas sp.]MDO9115056.1 hypothetical protein [Polaromonas sp.]MDP1884872.1 hypothetical protein [Polaromonas sp.]